MRALFRIDANETLGGGHVARCLSLAVKMKENGWEVFVASRHSSARYLSEVHRSGIQIILIKDGLNSGGETQFLKGLHLKPDTMIFDHYELDAEYERKCRSLTDTIVVLDDVPSARKHSADLLFDSAPGRQSQDWLPYLPETTKLYVGAQYALMRGEIVRARQRARSRRRTGNVRSALVSFGLTDPLNLSPLALRILRRAFPKAAILVALGGAARYLPEVQQEAEKQSADVLVDPEDFVDQLIAADLVVGAGGVSALERACLGVPSVAIQTAENQMQVLAGLARASAIVHAGTAEALTQAQLLSDISFASRCTQRLSAAAFSVIDGRGANRTLNEIETHLMKKFN